MIHRTIVPLLVLLSLPGVAVAQATTVSFYRLRIDYSTTSDWSTLDLKNPAKVLSIRVMAVNGKPTGLETYLDRLTMSQPLSAAEAGERVGVVVDLAVAPEVVDLPLVFLLQKGALNGSVVRVYSVTGSQAELLLQLDHSGAVPGNSALNPRLFSVDLSALKSKPPVQTQLARIEPQRKLWAFYYPWYHLADWSSLQLRDRPAARYSSDDPAAIARQIDQARSAGIDGFISSWWGPGDYTDKNLKRLLALAQERNFYGAGRRRGVSQDLRRCAPERPGLDLHHDVE